MEDVVEVEQDAFEGLDGVVEFGGAVVELLFECVILLLEALEVGVGELDGVVLGQGDGGVDVGA